MEQGKHRVMSRWPQYVHYFFPEISISPPKEDICDGYSERFVWSSRCETLLVRKNSAERDPGNTLKPKKVLSIAKKYLLAIPNEYIDYYPSLPDDPENNAKSVEYFTIPDDPNCLWHIF